MDSKSPKNASLNIWLCSSWSKNSRVPFSVLSVRPESEKPHWDSQLPEQPGETSFACPWAAFGTKPRSVDIAGLTSDLCRAELFKGFGMQNREILSSS